MVANVKCLINRIMRFSMVLRVAARSRRPLNCSVTPWVRLSFDRNGRSRGEVI